MSERPRRHAWLAPRTARAKLLPLVLALHTLFVAVPLHAKECAVIRGGSSSLSHVDASERLAFVREGLRVAGQRARIWTWGWAGALSAILVGQLAIAPLRPEAERIDGYVGAATATVGLASIAVLPLKVMNDQRWLERRLAAAGPDADPCALLSDAERLLLRDADNEHDGDTPLLQIANVALNLGASLVLGLGFGRFGGGLFNYMAGTVIGEAFILTQPRESVHTLKRYRAADLSPRKERPHIGFALAPSVTPSTVGLSLALTFD